MMFGRAREYLLSFDGIEEDILNMHLDDWKTSSPESIGDLLFGILDSVRNRQGMPNSIGEIERLRTVLYDFNPYQLASYFGWSLKPIFHGSGMPVSSMIDRYGGLGWKSYINQLFKPLSKFMAST